MQRYVALAVLCIAFTACSSGSSEPDAAPSTTTTLAPTTSTAPDPEAAILAAYQAYWDAYFSAASIPNPDLPALTETATGAQLDFTRDVVEGLAARGHRAERNGTMIGGAVTLTSNDRGVVADCIHDVAVVYDASTGAVVNDDGVWKRIEAELIQVGSVWKVLSVRVTEIAGSDEC